MRTSRPETDWPTLEAKAVCSLRDGGLAPSGTSGPELRNQEERDSATPPSGGQVATSVVGRGVGWLTIFEAGGDRLRRTCCSTRTSSRPADRGCGCSR